MTWAVLIPIIAQYGIPLAESLFQRWSSGSVPTQADFDALKVMASQSAAAIMSQQLTAAGIPLTDPHATALLGLVGAPTMVTPPPPPPPAAATPSLANVWKSS